MLHKRRIGRSGLMVVLMGVLAGCGSGIEVKVSRPLDATAMKRIAVVEFKHIVYQDDVADSVTFGKATSSNSGNIVASAVAQALRDAALLGYEILPRAQIVETLRGKGIKPEDVGVGNVKEVADVLGADYLVVGNVERFESGFFMMVEAATVAYSATCLEASTGKEVWRVSGKQTRLYEYEDRVAAVIAEEAVKKLRAQLSGPAPPPPPKPAPKATGGTPAKSGQPSKAPKIWAK